MEPTIIVHNSFFQRVFGWMFLGLSLTALTAFTVSSSDTLIYLFLSNIAIFYGLLLLELAIVMFMSYRVSKMSFNSLAISFILYSIINGLTFSIIFLVYTGSSIALTFLICAFMYGGTALYGYITKKDLSTVGSIAFMGLIGLLVASIINLFVNNEMIYWVTTYAGVLIFVALTAYDIQKIRLMSTEIGNENTEVHKKEAVMGALSLYLDFINLFLYLLRIFGKRK